MPSEYNPQLVENMSAKFRRLNNPAHAMVDAVGMLRMFPGVVGIWPGGVFGGGSASQSKLVDVSGNGLHLTRNGTTLARSTGLASYIEYDGSSGFYEHADASIFDIVGTETYIGASLRGLTIGCWVYFSALGTNEAVMSKMGASGNFSYILHKLSSNDAINFRISSDGSTLVSVTSDTLSAPRWYFICGRYDPSAELKIWLNGDAVSNTTSIPATIFSGNGPFAIGTYNSGVHLFDGYVSLAFLCAAAVPDIFIDTYFQMTTPLFGVSV